jgi:hypothetical protein
MDFITGLPRITRRKDTIWVIMDRLTISEHFIPICKNDSLEKLDKIYMEEVVRLHGVPGSIISDREPRFTSKFYDRMQKMYGTVLKNLALLHSLRQMDSLSGYWRICYMPAH